VFLLGGFLSVERQRTEDEERGEEISFHGCMDFRRRSQGSSFGRMFQGRIYSDDI
jgi:hypothetical protein